MKSFHGNDNIASTSHTNNLCKSVSLIYVVVLTVASIPSFECQKERRKRRVNRKGSLLWAHSLALPSSSWGLQQLIMGSSWLKKSPWVGLNGAANTVKWAQKFQAQKMKIGYFFGKLQWSWLDVKCLQTFTHLHLLSQRWSYPMQKHQTYRT